MLDRRLDGALGPATVAAALLRQGAQQQVDIMLAPSNDWRGIKDLHAQNARFRAIENGYAVVRPTTEGMSEIVDHQGRILTTGDYFHSGNDPTVVAHVPTRSTQTVYGAMGDVFAWLCLVSLTGLTAAAIRAGRIRLDN